MIDVDLHFVPASVQRVPVLVSIHEAKVRGQDFGLVSDAFIRVVNSGDDTELARFDLTVGADGEDCLAFGELYRDEGDWAFGAIGEYHEGGLAGGLRAYGVEVD